MLGILLASMLAPPVQAEITPAQGQVLSCLEALDQGTSWNQCLNLIFAPCADHTVGAAAHLDCLRGEQAEWENAMDDQRLALLRVLTPTGAADLGRALGQWVPYVTEKCETIAASRPAAPDAARLGCQITETVGVTGEFVACREGRSLVPYCQIAE